MPSHTKFYDLLGVPKNASLEEIKRAYKKMAIKYHPDKTLGNEDLFKDISSAYNILSDPQKRELYDRYGEDGLKEGPDAGSIFETLFKTQRSSSGRPKGKDVAITVDVSLEDLYNGKVQKVQLKKTVICTTCQGKGGRNSKQCNGCKGSGIKIITRQRGPYVEQMRTECHECHGSGEFIRSKDKCKKCRGNKIIEESKTLDLYIDKGMKHNQKILFSGEGDQHPDLDPGDIIFILKLKPHDVFKRKNEDLYMTKDITLIEALGGASFIITHLDGRELLIKTPPDQIISPNQQMCLENEGMPRHKSIYDLGKLIIKFNVIFPQTLDPETLKKLRGLLPEPETLPLMDTEPEEHVLSLYTEPEKENQNEAGAEDEEEEEILDFDGDEDDDHGPGVSCAQQ
jgi:DnaJ family protein A protein 2